MIPLAEEFRPVDLDELVGQEHLTGENGLIRLLIQGKKPLSLLLWGPPGCGKTSLARLYAKAFSNHWVSLSAVSSGINDLKKVVEEAQNLPLFSRKTLLFIDEIHRFNKSQQDFLLPFVEKGLLILVGATTENPSFHVNKALLSRLRVVELHPLDENNLKKLILNYERKKGALPLDEAGRQFLLKQAQGDARYLFNLLENLEQLPKETASFSVEQLSAFLQKRQASFDQDGEMHYNLISALHKAVRGSDPDAALYWFCRLLEGGEDPLFIARRLIRMATEDIGLADPHALNLAIAAKQAYESLGSPEGELALAEVVIYLALASKSNALYTAYKKAREVASTSSHLPPPKHILNAPTGMMKSLGYGKGYIYDHDTPQGISGQTYFPEDLPPSSFYTPTPRGFEKELERRLAVIQQIRQSKS